MSGRRPIAALVAALVCAACGAEPARAPVGERLNLVMISLDTCRADRLACYGYGRPTSPALDMMASEAVLFRDCLANSTSTAPSHMSLFTGQYPSRHGLRANGETTIPSHTLASVLAEAGWRTGAFTGHGSLQGKFGHGVGFEVFESWSDKASEDHYFRNLPAVGPDALAWIQSVGKEPFFLLVHGYDPHCPYWAPEPWRTEYTDWYEGGLELEERCGMPNFRKVMEDGELSEGDRRYLNDMYDAEVGAADSEVGRLLRELRQRGLLDRSIVVFTSDHGEVLGEHGFVGHTSLWEEEMHVPLIVRFPGGRWAGTRDEPVELVDVLPTLLSALGLETPPGVQGVDLMPVIRGEGPGPSAERMRLCEVSDSVSVRFDRRWKLVDGSRGEAWRNGAQGLFDLESDPGEERNLYGTPEGRERFDALRKRLDAWREAVREDDERYRGRSQSAAEDPEVREMLRALGYAGDEDEG